MSSGELRSGFLTWPSDHEELWQPAWGVRTGRFCSTLDVFHYKAYAPPFRQPLLVFKVFFR